MAKTFPTRRKEMLPAAASASDDNGADSQSKEYVSARSSFINQEGSRASAPADGNGGGGGEEDGESESESESESDGVLSPTSKKSVPSGELTKLPQRKRKAASPAGAVDHGQAGNSTEKQFEDKIASYFFLGMEVMALEKQLPGFYKAPFLKLSDAKARLLDAKLKKQRLAELRVFRRRLDMDKALYKAVIDLLK